MSKPKEKNAQVKDKELTILSLASTGNGCGFLKEKIKKQNGEEKEITVPYFVPFSVPGDVITIHNEKKEKKYIQAQLKKIIMPSPHRLDNPCKHYQQCGGCNILHIQYEEQLKQKKEIVKQILERNNITYPDIEVLPSQPNTNYRYKAKAFVMNNREGIIICGFKKKESTTIVPIEECHIVHPKIVAIIKKINELKLTLRDKTEITIVVDFTTQKTKIETASTNEEFIKILQSISDYVNKPVEFSYALGKKKITYDANTFIQSNLEQNKVMVKKILENIDKNDELVFDLYGGIGNFAITLSDNVEKIYCVEGDANSFAALLKNCTAQRIKNVRCIHEEVRHFLEHTQVQPQTVILDPPRIGCDEKIINALLRLAPKKILWVSCNQTALKDNLKMLIKDYVITKLYLIDMFPHTEHIESITVLEKSNPIER